MDKFVPPEITRRYCSLIPGSQYARMNRSGHIGMLTQPARFADIVAEFVDANHY
jgi:pimeloyl-ACP methyl ester carboxylesterase